MLKIWVWNHRKETICAQCEHLAWYKMNLEYYKMWHYSPICPFLLINSGRELKIYDYEANYWKLFPPIDKNLLCWFLFIMHMFDFHQFKQLVTYYSFQIVSKGFHFVLGTIKIENHYRIWWSAYQGNLYYHDSLLFPLFEQIKFPNSWNEFHWRQKDDNCRYFVLNIVLPVTSDIFKNWLAHVMKYNLQNYMCH